MTGRYKAIWAAESGVAVTTLLSRCISRRYLSPRQDQTQWCTILAEGWQHSQSEHIARVVYAREKGMAETRTPSMLQVFNEHFDRAARYVKAPADLLEYIRSCHSMYSIKFPVRIRGEIQIFHAYRAEHSHHRIPTKGVFALPRTSTSTKWQRWQP